MNDMEEKRLYHKIANELLELIDSGVFPPGSRLPGERALADQFGVSRVAVREAEIALQAQGRIAIRGGSGAYVLDGSERELTGLPRVGPFELTEARALFEAEAAALAAPIITDETIAELEKLVAIMSGDTIGEVGSAEADALFHRTIARATNNHAIIFVIDSLWKMRDEAARVQSIYRRVCAADSAQIRTEHNEILDALRDRNPSAARKAMRAHFARMIDALLEASEEEAYKEVKRKAAESRSRYMLSRQLS